MSDGDNNLLPTYKAAKRAGVSGKIFERAAEELGLTPAETRQQPDGRVFQLYTPEYVDQHAEAIQDCRVHYRDPSMIAATAAAQLLGITPALFRDVADEFIQPVQSRTSPSGRRVYVRYLKADLDANKERIMEAAAQRRTTRRWGDKAQSGYRQRDLCVAAMREQGWTYQRIASLLSLTRQRVEQICANTKLSDEWKSDQRWATAKECITMFGLGCTSHQFFQRAALIGLPQMAGGSSRSLRLYEIAKVGEQAGQLRKSISRLREEANPDWVNANIAGGIAGVCRLTFETYAARLDIPTKQDGRAKLYYRPGVVAHKKKMQEAAVRWKGERGSRKVMSEVLGDSS
jgi:hypothetical protein